MILSLVDLSTGFSLEFNFLYVSEFIYISVSCFLVFVSSLCLSCPPCICFPSHVFVYSLSVSCLFSYLRLSPYLSLPRYLCLCRVSVFHLLYQFSCSYNRENWAQDCIFLCWGLNAKPAGPVSLDTVFKLAWPYGVVCLFCLWACHWLLWFYAKPAQPPVTSMPQGPSQLDPLCLSSRVTHHQSLQALCSSIQGRQNLLRALYNPRSLLLRLSQQSARCRMLQSAVLIQLWPWKIIVCVCKTGCRNVDDKKCVSVPSSCRISTGFHML